MSARLLAVFLVVAAAALPARALSLLPVEGDGLGWLKPSGQDALSFLPAGGLAEDPWEPGIVTGQFAASVVLSTAGAILFTTLGDRGLTEGVDIWAMRKTLFVNTILDFLITPLVSATAVWGIGSLSEMYSVGYFIPLGVDYAMTLVLSALRMVFNYAIVDLHHGETVSKSVDVLGFFLYVDWILHGLLVGAATTYFSIRSRDVNMSMAARAVPAPALVAGVRPTYRSLCDEREERARASEPTAGVQLSLASVAF